MPKTNGNGVEEPTINRFINIDIKQTILKILL